MRHTMLLTLLEPHIQLHPAIFSFTYFMFYVSYCCLSSGETYWTSNRSLIIELHLPLEQTSGLVPTSPLSAPCTSSHTFPLSLLYCYTGVWHGARFSPLMSSYLPPPRCLSNSVKSTHSVFVAVVKEAACPWNSSNAFH